MNLKEDDRAILLDLNALIGNKTPLRFKDYSGKRVILPMGVQGYRKNQWVLNIHSKKLWTRIQELGCPCRKSKILAFPEWMPDSLFYAFLRGVLEGDGCITKNKPTIRIYGTQEFLTGIQTRLQALSGIKAGIYRGDGVFVLAVNTQSQAMSALEEIYRSDQIPFLSRKKEIYLKHKLTKESRSPLAYSSAS
jgi:hypothetical protein